MGFAPFPRPITRTPGMTDKEFSDALRADLANLRRRHERANAFRLVTLGIGVVGLAIIVAIIAIVEAIR